MAPRKEKSEKASGDQGAAMMLEYLRKQKSAQWFHYVYLVSEYMQLMTQYTLLSRPYSATDISANLHNKVTKTQAAKTLKEMHDRNEIAGRPAGKQIVYHALQDPNEAASAEEVATMDQEIETIRAEIIATKVHEKLLKANLATVNATLSTDDLRGNVIALELGKEQILARLVPLRSGSAKPVSLEETSVVDREWKEWQRHWSVRKKIAMEVWAYATEVLPEGTTKEDLWESLGLELDP